VTALTSQIRARLETGFPLVWVEGEISNVRCPSSGHRYFTLQDQTSQIRVVLFRQQAERVRCTLQEGLEVIVCGRLSVYETRGEYQLLVELVEPKGLGERQFAFLQLKAKLESEGLFDRDRKRPLPPFPQTIGLVTSPSGAALHDFLTVLHRRWPLSRLLLAPVVVQGPASPVQICEAIRTLNQTEGVDVIIVGRGGGASEDLWAFNDESVVRTIASSHIPVVAAVGHETDFTLADFAADCRAPTPSAAAELVAPARLAVSHGIQQFQVRLIKIMQGILTKGIVRVQRFTQRFPEPRLAIRQYSQRVDDMAGNLYDCLTRRYRDLFVHLLQTQAALWGQVPQTVIARGKDRLFHLRKDIDEILKQHLQNRRHHAHAMGSQLHQLNPVGVLGRGYSIVQRASDEKILKDFRDVSTGEMVRVTLHRGRLICKVQQADPQ
ncbi:MAG: exodeoxyribonuclease VII large subunit, partial [Nitrospirales bacterium]|nr:exodeoxyribonuclease VII large subunit [Nitrospirales bacterium]